MDVHAETYEVVDVMYSTARGEMSAEKLTEWLRDRLVPFKSLDE